MAGVATIENLDGTVRDAHHLRNASTPRPHLDPSLRPSAHPPSQQVCGEFTGQNRFGCTNNEV
jgi:hypothetical protein